MQSYGFEWSIGYLWRHMTWIGHLDVIVLALMFAYVAAVVVRVSYRCRAALRARAIETAHDSLSSDRKKLVADLNIHVGNLNSIASAAPFLGLVGTCLGILSTFRGYSGSPAGLVVMVASGTAAALVATAAGLLVAIPATWAYNYARTCIDSLQTKLSSTAPAREDHSVLFAQRLPLTKRFSQLPAYALIAAPTLAIAVAAFTLFGSFHRGVGFGIRIASTRCEKDLVRPVVLHVTSAGKLFLNLASQDRTTLTKMLSLTFSTRSERTVYLVVDNDVPFQTAVEVIDLVRSTSFATLPSDSGTMPQLEKNNLNMSVSLVTPTVAKAGCPAPIVMP